MSEEDTPVKAATGDRLTDAEFASAKERYELGTDTLMALADEFKISRQGLSGRFKRNGVVKGSRAGEIGSATAAAAKSAVVAADRFTDRRAEWIEETRIQGVQALKQARLIGQKIIIDEIKKPAGDLQLVEGAAKVIARHSKMLADNIEATLRILNADEYTDPEDLPILSIEDLTNQEILDHHITTGALPEDTTIEEMIGDELQLEGID